MFKFYTEFYFFPVLPQKHPISQKKNAPSEIDKKRPLPKMEKKIQKKYRMTYFWNHETVANKLGRKNRWSSFSIKTLQHFACFSNQDSNQRTLRFIKKLYLY